MWGRKSKRRDAEITKVGPSMQGQIDVLSPFEAYKRAVPEKVTMYDIKPAHWEVVAANALREVIARLERADDSKERQNS